jgi:hypothetical protein
MGGGEAGQMLALPDQQPLLALPDQPAQQPVQPQSPLVCPASATLSEEVLMKFLQQAGLHSRGRSPVRKNKVLRGPRSHASSYDCCHNEEHGCGHFQDCGHTICDCGHGHAQPQHDPGKDEDNAEGHHSSTVHGHIQGHSHSSGHNHGNCHGHSDGHCTGHGSADPDVAIIDGQAVVIDNEVALALPGSSGDGSSSQKPWALSWCADKQCCPEVQADQQVMRLNSHCGFKGHCVQLKNTFLHLECVDSEGEGECVVCKFKRSRSCDHIRPARDRASTD